MHIELTKKHRDRIRDFVLYLVISLTLAGIMLAYAISGVDEETFMRRIFFVMYTLFAFGYLIERSKALWKKSSFWLLTSFLLLLHCIVLAAILPRIKHLGGGYISAGILEAAFLLSFSRWLLPSTPIPQ